MDIYIAIATRDRETLLERTLASVGQCRIPEGFKETLVVENGARGRTEHVVNAAPPSLRAHYMFEAVGNKSRSLNAALAPIRQGLIIFLDDDVRVPPDLLERYAAAGREAGPGRFFGGPVAPDYEEEPPSWVLAYLPASATGWKLEDEPADGTGLRTFLGFNWAAFAEDIHRVGGFSEDFGPGSATGSIGQESYMQRRLLAEGGQALYVRDALVHHWVPKDRCSPAFAAERAFKDGIRTGLLKANYHGRFVAGYPIRQVRKSLQQWMRWQLRRLGGSSNGGFAERIAFEHARGVARGLALKRSRENRA